MAAGFRIKTRERAVASMVVEQFRALPVANISDSMNRMSAAGAHLRPMHSSGIMAGPAITVKTRPGDNLMVHAALDRAQAGDVLVVDAGGDLTNAIIGELMVAHAQYLKLAGIVINGAVRDIAAIRAGTFPVFAAGVSHRGPYKDGPGEVNVPISIGGMIIVPGDLVVGDDDGVVAVGYDDVDQVFSLASAKLQAETAQLERIAIGQNDRAWVERALAAAGCEFSE